MNDAQMNAMAISIAESIRETECKIAMDVIEKSGLIKQFNSFYLKWKGLYILDCIKEFGKLHPDKFHVIPEEEKNQYSKMILRP